VKIFREGQGWEIIRSGFSGDFQNYLAGIADAKRKVQPNNAYENPRHTLDLPLQGPAHPAHGTDPGDGEHPPVQPAVVAGEESGLSE
jgi:hypothetical protein